MNEKIIVKMKFGSYLYGTATENSDIDYKGVVFPTKEQLFLGNIPRSINLSTNKSRNKNTANDTDEEYYSLHKFINLACAGETVAIDMLHAPLDFCEVTHPLWELLVKNREKFYTKNLRAFVGYARRQAAKYGVKGSRLNAAKEVLDLIKTQDPTSKLSSIWGALPTNEYSFFMEPSPEGIKQYQICGRTIQETCSISYAYEIVNRFYENYGQRAHLAATNQNIDWKAVSHAIRAAYQVKELLTSKTITFPRPEAAFLLEVKQGKLDYLTKVGPKLDSLMEEVEELSLNSDLPETTDRKYFDGIIIYAMQEYVL